MAFNHRKLIFGALNQTRILIQPCEPYCNLYLPPPPPPPPPPITSYNPPSKSPKLPLYLTISLSILVATFTLFCCYIVYRWFKGWYRSRNRSSQLELDGTGDDFLEEGHEPSVDHHVWYIRTVGLNPSTINAITICKYKKTDGLVEGTDCSVCLNEFQEDETLRLLPKCNHAFHIPCIDTWLMSHTNCPLCRASVVNSTTTGSPAPEMVVDDSSHVEETQLGIPEEDENNEIEMVEMSERDDDVEVGQFQPVRRSVSLDSSSASMISSAIANAHHPGRSAGILDTQLVKVGDMNIGFVPKRVDINKSLLRLMGSSSIVRSLQKGPISMKRSFSCSGKPLSSRHGRSRNLILPS